MPDDFQYVRNWMQPGVSDRQAIQGAIDYMLNNWGGGDVYLPPTTLTISDSPIYVTGGVRLLGAGMSSVIKSADGADIPLCTLLGYKPVIKSIFFQGLQSKSATQNVVSVIRNCPALIKECEIRGGNSALYTEGCDGTVEDCFIYGAKFACLTSRGANWYKRVKFDGSGQAANDPDWCMFLGNPIPECATAMENSFEQCDMSGAWNSNYALGIFDGNGATADTRFFGGIFSGGLNISQAIKTEFIGSKFGSPYYSYGPQCGNIRMIGCDYIGTGSIATSNATKVACVGNFA